MTPLAPERFGWQLTVSQETQDLLRDVQDLLGHDVPPGDLEAVLNFALRAAKEKLLKRKCAETEQPRHGHRRSNSDGRHIPAEVRRAVWQRDGGQCTFTSDTGHRCKELMRRKREARQDPAGSARRTSALPSDGG